MRIATYNIRHGLGIDGRVDLNRIAAVLREIDADIICLQEVESLCPRTGMVRQAQKLGDLLGGFSLYHNNISLGALFGMGNAILAKSALYATRNTFLPSHGERRGVLHAQLDIDSTPIHVFCTHFGLKESQRQVQAQRCLDLIADEANGSAVLFCGDLNAQPRSPEVRSLLESGILSSATALSELRTFPSDCPYAQIDYIFHSAHFRCDKASVFPTEASDHLPLVADLTLVST